MEKKKGGAIKKGCRTSRQPKYILYNIVESRLDELKILLNSLNLLIELSQYFVVLLN